MGREMIDDSYQLIDPTSAYGVFSLFMTALVMAGDISFLLWLLIRKPYKRHAKIRGMMIFVLAFDLVYIFTSILNAFTDSGSSRIFSGLANWSASFLVFSMYILELEILMIFVSLSTSLSRSKVTGMQTLIVLLHFASYAVGYCAIGLLLCGITALPAWVQNSYLLASSAGMLIVIICNIIQSILVAALLYRFIMRKKVHGDLTDQEMDQISFQRKLVIQYLVWIFVIALLDLTTLTISYLGTFQTGYTCTYLLGARVLEIIVAFHYVIQIPFRSATASANLSSGGKEHKEAIKGMVKWKPSKDMSPNMVLIKDSRENSRDAPNSNNRSQLANSPSAGGGVMRDTVKDLQPLGEKATVLIDL